MNQTAGFNPTPISKLCVIVILALSLTAEVNEIFVFGIVLFIALFFALNQRAKTAIKVIVFYFIVVMLVENGKLIEFSFVKNYLLIFAVVIKIFFLPILAGKFLIATSDVSSLIVSFEKLRFPKVMIIPLAVMFRYFPAFKDDRRNVKWAMKMRGITLKNPIRYLEYVSVPILISATNIGDDISKAAETKCIADPCPKVRYREVKFTAADPVFIIGIIALNLLGRVYA